MRKFTKKHYVAAGAAAVIVAAGAGTAFAYWSSTGTGSGTGSTGTGTNDLSAVSVATSALVPGGNSVVDFAVHNSNANSSEHFASVGYTITPSVPGCSASYFTITGLPTNQTVAANGTTHQNITVSFADSADNQDVCKDNTLAIAYTLN
jgi:hypothetical protein